MKNNVKRFAVLCLGGILAVPPLSGPAFCAGRSGWKGPPGRFTNPLLKYSAFRELRPFYSPITERIELAVKNGEVGSAAVYFRSLSDGMWFGISERDEFAPASILKIPIMVAWYKLAEREPSVLRKKLRYFFYYPEEALEGYSAVPGKYYTVERLIDFMITESNNSAASILADSLPSRTMIGTFWDFGVDIRVENVKDSFISLKVIASMLRVLYNASYLNEKLSEKALQLLSKSKFNDGIRAGVPEKFTVAHKYGRRSIEETGEKQLHEVAIVYYPDNPYLLAVMTKGDADDYSKLAALIKDISAITFREVSRQQEAEEGAEPVVIE